MKVFWCFYDSQWGEWGAYVVAESRGKAKSIFYGNYKEDGEWIDIRCHKVKDISDDIKITPRILDEPGDPMLKKLGLKYREEEY